MYNCIAREGNGRNIYTLNEEEISGLSLTTPGRKARQEQEGASTQDVLKVPSVHDFVSLGFFFFFFLGFFLPTNSRKD